MRIWRFAVAGAGFGGAKIVLEIPGPRCFVVLYNCSNACFSDSFSDSLYQLLPVRHLSG